MVYGSPGWGDVAVVSPWDIYVRTGDITILEDNYDHDGHSGQRHTKIKQMILLLIAVVMAIGSSRTRSLMETERILL